MLGHYAIPHDYAKIQLFSELWANRTQNKQIRADNAKYKYKKSSHDQSVVTAL